MEPMHSQHIPSLVSLVYLKNNKSQIYAYYVTDHALYRNKAYFEALKNVITRDLSTI